MYLYVGFLINISKNSAGATSSNSPCKHTPHMGGTITQDRGELCGELGSDGKILGRQSSAQAQRFVGVCPQGTICTCGRGMEDCTANCEQSGDIS